MSSNTNTNIAPQNARPQHRPRPPQRLARSAQDIVQNPPPGWLAKVLELDPTAPPDKRLRLRLIAFEHPDKGYRLLPFLTVRTPKRMETENGQVETMDDMDILPNNPLEAALPAITVAPHDVLENLTIVMAEYAKKQVSLPPPSKKPLTHRPFTPNIMSHVKAAEQPRQQTSARSQPSRTNKKNTRAQHASSRSSHPDHERRKREVELRLNLLFL